MVIRPGGGGGGLKYLHVSQPAPACSQGRQVKRVWCTQYKLKVSQFWGFTPRYLSHNATWKQKKTIFEIVAARHGIEPQTPQAKSLTYTPSLQKGTMLHVFGNNNILYRLKIILKWYRSGVNVSLLFCATDVHMLSCAAPNIRRQSTYDVIILQGFVDLAKHKENVEQ